jgi:hypothetical protein
MIIANFDGNNMSVLLEAIEFKIINAIAKHLPPDVATTVSTELAQSGFVISPEEVNAIAQSIYVMGRRLSAAVSVSPICPNCNHNVNEEESNKKLLVN